MKRLAVVLMLCASLQSAAQTFVVHNADGSTTRIPITEIRRITFDLSTDIVAAPRSAHTINKIKTVTASIVPNPFSNRINYSVAEASLVRIAVYDMKGALLRTITDAHKESGNYVAHWNGRTDAGTRVVDGPYIAKVQIDGSVFSKTLVIVN